MNKCFRAMIHVPCGMIKFGFVKLFHGGKFKGSPICAVSPLTEITLDRGGRLTIGREFRMRDGSKLRVRRGAVCSIGKNVSMSHNNIITCRDRITIGDNVQLSPNVLIYDHDHDYSTEGGIGAKKFKTAPIIIGSNCWLGANTTVLRGTQLGDNCVVGAGCVLNGQYPAGSVIIQKRATTVIQHK